MLKGVAVCSYILWLAVASCTFVIYIVVVECRRSNLATGSVS